MNVKGFHAHDELARRELEHQTKLEKVDKILPLTDSYQYEHYTNQRVVERALRRASRSWQ